MALNQASYDNLPPADELIEVVEIDAHRAGLVAAQTSPAEQFGVPRRFGIGTILVVMGASSVLLAFLVAWGVSAPMVFLLVAFLAVVGLGQAFFFRGTNPRLASVLTGALFCPIYTIGLMTYLSYSRKYGPPAEEVILGFMFSLVLGPLFGYLGGGVVGGIFLIMDRWEQKFGRKMPALHYDPFAPDEVSIKAD